MVEQLAKGFRFCLVGGVVFGIDFFMIWLLNKAIPALAAVSTAYIVAVAVHFCLNKWWVFQSTDRPTAGQIGKYLLALLLCWGTTITVVSLCLSFVSPNVYLAKLIAIVPTTVLGFVLMRKVVFRQSITQT